MILHLERKFTSLTETFIVNQINAVNNFTHAVFTVKNLNNLPANATIFTPPLVQSAWDLKLLLKKNVNYFNEQKANIDIQLIHSHFLTDASYFHSFTKHINVPKICSCYGYDVSKFPPKYGLLSKFYLKRVFKEYDFFLAMSEDMALDLAKLGCPEHKIKIHYHGSDTKKIEGSRQYLLHENHLNILTIGSLEPKKGHLASLKAINKVRDQHPGLLLKYTIVGKGTLQKQLSEYVAANGLEDIVVFKGFVRHGSEFNALLMDANIFLHPSVTTPSGDKEGIPGAIVEAMASGLPVITTYHAGIPGIIENGVTGFLFLENDIDGIAGKIIDLASLDLQRLVGQNAQKYAREHLDSFAQAKGLEKIYNDLLT